MKPKISAATLCIALSAFSASANTTHNQLQSLSEKDRAQVLARVLTKTGEKCSKPSTTFYQGSDKRGAAFWNIQCTENAYQLMIESDNKGSAKAIGCDVLKMLGSSCFTKFK